MALADRAQKGLILKQAREAKGISLEAVQDATKIPLDSLKAIEEGYRVRTMTDFYYRAFVKLYAKYLGVDINAVIEDYHDEQIPQPVKFHKGKTIWEDESAPLMTRVQIKNTLKVLGALIAVLIVVRLAGCWIRSRPHQDEKPQAKTIQKADVVKKQAEKTTEAKRPSTVSVAQTASQKNTSSLATSEKRKKQKINLTVRSKKATWISVRMDGVDLSRFTLSKGAAESWQANDSIEITGKNLADLEFELNGQPQSSFTRTTRRIKRIIVNQDGFTIED
ncbi:MAG TPA: DUF4115 domain-containing protein [Candidatus Omnitrophota bacterium]|nr:DUF4115 domain-containing protein [Candidatus Omnitrophota bacterium]